MTDEVNQENEQTPTESSAEEKAPETIDLEDGDNEEAKSPEPRKEEMSSEEEASWNSLSGSSQDRFRKVIRENADYRQKLEDKQGQQAVEDLNKVAQQPQDVSDEEVQKAVSILRSKGRVATQDDLDALWGMIKRDKDHERLATKYEGQEGLPKYDKVEVEDYMKRKNIWDPEAAFRDMYFDEFVDKGKQLKKKTFYTEKPTRSEKEEPLTMETFRDKLSGPKGRELYDKLAKNPQKFDEIMEQLSKG